MAGKFINAGNRCQSGTGLTSSFFPEILKTGHHVFQTRPIGDKLRQQMICRPGKISLFPNLLSNPLTKNILIFRSRKSVHSPAIPSQTKGRFAIVTDVGGGMRWTRMCL
jgi:hypothetical protein